jgi:DNA-directed RNA polymerase specialized sigma24 family protein
VDAQERAAFDAALGEVYPRLRALFDRRCAGSGLDGATVLHDALLVTARKFGRPGLTTPEQVAAYTTTVGMNLHRKRVGKAGKDGPVEVIGDPAVLDRRANVPAAVDAERLEAVYDALTPDQSVVLEMTADGMTDVQIAAATGRSPGAVRMLLHRARQNARAAWDTVAGAACAPLTRLRRLLDGEPPSAAAYVAAAAACVGMAAAFDPGTPRAAAAPALPTAPAASAPSRGASAQGGGNTDRAAGATPPPAPAARPRPAAAAPAPTATPAPSPTLLLPVPLPTHGSACASTSDPCAGYGDRIVLAGGPNVGQPFVQMCEVWPAVPGTRCERQEPPPAGGKSTPPLLHGGTSR